MEKGDYSRNLKAKIVRPCTLAQFDQKLCYMPNRFCTTHIWLLRKTKTYACMCWWAGRFESSIFAVRPRIHVHFLKAADDWAVLCVKSHRHTLYMRTTNAQISQRCPLPENLETVECIGRQWQLWPDCMEAQADLGLTCPHMPFSCHGFVIDLVSMNDYKSKIDFGPINFTYPLLKLSPWNKLHVIPILE